MVSLKAKVSAMLASAIVLLSACEPTQTYSGPPPVAPDGARLNASSAMEIFARVCIDTSPRFQNAARVAQGLGFQRDAESGDYINASLNTRLMLSAPESAASMCNLTFVAVRGDEAYQTALRNHPRVAPSQTRGLETFLFVDGNGQKSVLFAGLQQFKGSQLRSYLMLVGADAERFDR